MTDSASHGNRMCDALSLCEKPDKPDKRGKPGKREKLGKHGKPASGYFACPGRRLPGLTAAALSQMYYTD